MTTDTGGAGALRLLRAEARQQERERLIQILEDQSAKLWRQARELGPRPGWTSPGRQSYSIDRTIAMLRHEASGDWSSNAGKFVGSVATDCDTVELYEYDPAIGEDGNEAEEPMPVRLVVVDGADGTAASAFLSLDEALEVALEIRQVIERIRNNRAARAAS